MDELNELFLEEFLQSLELRGCSQGTLDGYELVTSNALNWIDKNVEEITIHDIRRYFMKESSKGNKQSTLNTKINVLKSFFKWLIREELISKNPMLKMMSSKEKKREPKFLTKEEITKIREAAIERGKLIDRVLVEVLYSSGIRVSEAVNLNWENIDFENKELRVINGKGGKNRTTYLSPEAIFLLKKYKEEREDDNQWVFQSNYKRRMSKESIERHIKKLGEKSNIKKNLTPHKFRHSMATVLGRKGVSIDIIQEILGHENISTTRIYITTNETNVNFFHQQAFS